MKFERDKFQILQTYSTCFKIPFLLVAVAVSKTDIGARKLGRNHKTQVYYVTLQLILFPNKIVIFYKSYLKVARRLKHRGIDPLMT